MSKGPLQLLFFGCLLVFCAYSVGAFRHRPCPKPCPVRPEPVRPKVPDPCPPHRP